MESLERRGGGGGAFFAVSRRVRFARTNAASGGGGPVRGVSHLFNVGITEARRRRTEGGTRARLVLPISRGAPGTRCRCGAQGPPQLSDGGDLRRAVRAARPCRRANGVLSLSLSLSLPVAGRAEEEPAAANLDRGESRLGGNQSGKINETLKRRAPAYE